jgi:hypothetical protein
VSCPYCPDQARKFAKQQLHVHFASKHAEHFSDWKRGSGAPAADRSAAPVRSTTKPRAPRPREVERDDPPAPAAPPAKKPYNPIDPETW